MQARLKLKPGQRGTKRLLEQYGSRLVCVRYRYDAQQKRFKTVELIVAEIPWTPAPVRFQPEEIVSVRVAFQETDLQRLVKQAGGKWHLTRRVWESRYDQALKLGLRARIETPKTAKGGKQKAANIR